MAVVLRCARKVELPSDSRQLPNRLTARSNVVLENLWREKVFHDTRDQEGMHRVLVLADAATGLRISEILALRWSDIDKAHSCIRVTRAYLYGKFGPPKSKASKKPVPLHPLLANALDDWRKETPYSADYDFVFPSMLLKGKKPPRANMLVADHLQPAARKAGIDDPVSTRYGAHLQVRWWKTETMSDSCRNCCDIQTLSSLSMPMLVLQHRQRSKRRDG